MALRNDEADWEDVEDSGDDGWEDVEPGQSMEEIPERPGVFRQIADTIGNWDGARFSEGLQQPVSFGDDIPIFGSAKRSIGNAFNAATEADSFEDFGKRYWQAQDADQVQDQEFAQRYPEAALTRGIASGFAFPAGRAGNMVKGTGVGSVLGRYGANVGENVAVTAMDTALRGGDPLRAAQDAGEFSAVVLGVPTALNLAGRGYSRFVAGIPEETRQKYVQNRDRINNISEETVVDELAGDIDNVRDRISQREQSIHGKAGEYRKHADAEFAEQKANAASTAKQKQAEIRQWIAQKRASDQAGADTIRRQAADQAFDTMSKGKEQIQKGSKFAAQQIPDDLEIPLNPYKKGLRRAMKQGSINDAPAEGPGYSTIQNYRDFLGKMGGEFVDNEQGIPEFIPHETISGGDIKRLIQKIDRDLESYYANPQGFADPGAKALVRMRQGLDRSLKRQSPDYRNAMVPVAKQSRARSNFQDQFGSDADSIYRRMNDLDDVGVKDRAQALSDFDDAFGSKTSKTLETSRELPSKNYEGMQRFLNEGVAGEEAFARSKAQRKYDARKQNAQQYTDSQMEKVNAEKKKFAGLGADDVQSKIRRVGGNPKANIMAKRKIEAVAKASGKDPGYYTQAADDLAVQRAMEGTFVRGSRNVNMMRSSLSGLVKALTGSDSASATADSFGSIIGGISDIAGPKLVKFTIDAGEWLPKGVKNTLAESLKRGAQAYVITHEMLMRKDPAYRKAYEYWESQEGDDE